MLFVSHTCSFTGFYDERPVCEMLIMFETMFIMLIRNFGMRVFSVTKIFRVWEKGWNQPVINYHFEMRRKFQRGCFGEISFKTR